MDTDIDYQEFRDLRDLTDQRAWEWQQNRTPEAWEAFKTTRELLFSFRDWMERAETPLHE